MVQGVAQVTPRRRALMTCLLAIAVGLVVVPRATADVAPQKNWKRLQTPNFHLLGNASDGDMRDVAERLEQFRDAMALLFTKLKPATNRPRVLVFRNHRSYDPFKPQYDGKPASVGGYFLRGQDVDTITLTVENRDDNFGVIYHEYVHLLMADSIGTLPIWVSEGLAEYYSSFTTTANGKQAFLGRPHASHVYRLREEFLPLPELVGAQRDSSHYNERDKKGVFYAESWALVHYLLLGDQQRYAPQAAALVGALAEGQPFDRACRDILKVEPAQLERGLRRYIRDGQFMQQVATFEDRLNRLTALPLTPATEADVHAALGDLLQRLGRDEDAEAQLKRALELEPESPMAHAALGQLRVRQQRAADARDHLERAARSDSATYLTHFQLALLLNEALREQGTARDETLVGRQEAALRKSVSLNPGFAEAWYRLGLLVSTKADGAAEALSDVEQAATLAPGREHYRLTLAYLHANAQRFAAARIIARLLVERGADDTVRAQAQALLERIAAFERHALQAKAAAATTGTPAADAGTRFDEMPAAAGPRAVIPVFREPQAGEERAFGYLVAIECKTDAVVLHLDVDGRAVTASAPRFDAIDFITYRDDLTGNLSCGKRSALDAVVATFRRSAAAAPHVGTAIAIEFVPKGYIPTKP